MSDTTRAVWRKSSYSGNNEGACVEVAQQPNGVAARDSKRRDGDVLRFGVGAWGAFVRGIRG
ncbi:DUF397 domain-containing protein [Actinocorallia lasiicapitis]